jgi:prophage regulatory protein
MITVVSPNAESIRILRLPQVCEVAGLCRSMIYQMETDLRFPQRVKIGTRAVGWVEKEVNAWLMRRISKAAGLATNRAARLRIGASTVPVRNRNRSSAQPCISPDDLARRPPRTRLAGRRPSQTLPRQICSPPGLVLRQPCLLSTQPGARPTRRAARFSSK